MQRVVLFLTLSIFSYSTFGADNFLEFGNVNFGRDYKEKSKWHMRMGSEQLSYQAKLPPFSGKHREIKAQETDIVNGYGLSIGRDFYLGWGISTQFNIGGYYSNSVHKIIGKAAEDIDIDFAETRTNYQINAYESSLSFNYLFDYRVVDIQPFIEAGAGAGTSKLEKRYKRMGLPSETNGSENYLANIEESFAFSRVSLGVNFISYRGIMSYLKFSSVQMLKLSRETEGSSNAFGTAAIVDVYSKEDNLKESVTTTLISVGVGRYF